MAKANVLLEGRTRNTYGRNLKVVGITGSLLLASTALVTTPFVMQQAMAATLNTTASANATDTSDAADAVAAALAAYTADPTAANKSALDTAIAAYNAAIASEATDSLADSTTIDTRTEIASGYASVVNITAAGAGITGLNNTDGDSYTETDGSSTYRAGAIYVDGGALYIGSSSGETTLISNNSVIATTSSDDAQGGAIYNNGGTLSVDNASFSGNYVDSDSGDAYGGAITSSSGVTIVTNSTFTGNYATADANAGSDKSYARGGAINSSNGLLYVYNSTFTGNYASGDDVSSSGAINVSGTGYIVDSTFTGNYASGGADVYGGAILNYGTLTISGSTFTGNYAVSTDSGADANGGAIRNHSASAVLTIIDSDFIQNYVSADTAEGGAIYNNGGTINLQVTSGSTSTFSGNTANGVASSIYMNGGTLNVDVASDGVLDMRDPMSGSSATISKTGSGTWKLGGSNTFSGTTSFTVSEGTLYLYDADEVSNASLADTSATVSDGSITLTGSNSSFTLGSSATLVAGGTNSVSTSGTLTIADGATIRGGTDADRSDGATNIASTLTLTGSGGTQLQGSLTVEAVDSGDTLTLIADLTDASGYTGSLTKTGDGTVILQGSNSYTGTTTVEAGTLQAGSSTAFVQNTAYVVNGGTLDLNDYDLAVSSLSGTGGAIDLGSASLTVDQDSDTSYAGAITGTGSLTKSGSGTLTLSGTSTYTGATTVDEGILLVDGLIASYVTVNDDGTLGGSGTVGGVTVSSGGTLSPGNDSIATLTVTGNVTLESGSTYAVDVAADGTSDLLSVSGTVTIDSGSIIYVTGTDEESTYSVGTTYTVISATGGVTGTFSEAYENFAYLSYDVTYDANNVYLTLTRTTTGEEETEEEEEDVIEFKDKVKSGNGRKVAGVIEGLDEDSELYQAALYLKDGETESAFVQLSGEIHAGIAAALLERSDLSRNAVNDRLRDAFGETAGTAGATSCLGDKRKSASLKVAGCDVNAPVAWINGFGAWSNFDGDTTGSAVQVSGGGFLMGADRQIGNNWRFGLVTGYGHDQISDNTAYSSANVDSYYAGAYGGTSFGPAFLRFGGLYALSQVRSDRTVDMSTFHDHLKASYTTQLTQTFAEGSWRIDTAFARFSPYANAALVHLDTASFTEKGGAAALSSNGESYTQGFTTLGMRIDQDFALGGALANASFGMGWRHTIGDVAQEMDLSFADSDPFDISSTSISRDAVLVNAGFGVNLMPGAKVSLNYNGTFATGLAEQSVNARLGMKF